MKLETYMVKQGENASAYITFPTTRKALRKRLQKIGVVKNDWKIVAVKTGCDAFADAVIACRNLDELNYMGFWFSQFSEEEYYLFFELANAGCAEGDSLTDYINLASNIKCFFRLDGIKDTRTLGRYIVAGYLRKHGEEAPEIIANLHDELEDVGLQHAAEYHGRFYNGNFYGRYSTWSQTYNGEDDDIPDFLCIDSIRI